MQKSLHKEQGGWTLLVLMAVIAFIGALSSTYYAILLNRARIQSRVSTQDSLIESTKSSFTVMESALKRRMWESSRCELS